MSIRHIPKPHDHHPTHCNEPLRLYLARRYTATYLLNRAEFYAQRCHEIALEIANTTREGKIRRLLKRYETQEQHLNFWLMIRRQQLGQNPPDPEPDQ